MTPSDLAEAVVSAVGYPRITHRAINALTTTTLTVAPSADIAPRCLLRGTVDIESGVRLSARCVLNGEVSIGKQTNIEPECEFVGDVEIGNYCAIARRNTFQQTDHEMEKPSIQRRLYQNILDSELAYSTKGPITVGSDVWFGTRGIVLSGVTIGHGAVVAAGSVVTSDVEPYAIVAGTPAERIGWRFPRDVRNALLELSWWKWDDERIQNYPEFFNSQLQAPDDVPSPAEASVHNPAPSP